MNRCSKSLWQDLHPHLMRFELTASAVGLHRVCSIGIPGRNCTCDFKVRNLAFYLLNYGDVVFLVRREGFAPPRTGCGPAMLLLHHHRIFLHPIGAAMETCAPLASLPRTCIAIYALAAFFVIICAVMTISNHHDKSWRISHCSFQDQLDDYCHSAFSTCQLTRQPATLSILVFLHFSERIRFSYDVVDYSYLVRYTGDAPVPPRWQRGVLLIDEYRNYSSELVWQEGFAPL